MKTPFKKAMKCFPKVYLIKLIRDICPGGLSGEVWTWGFCPAGILSGGFMS